MMSTQSQRNIRARNIKTSEDQTKENWLLKQIHRHVLRKAFRRLNRTAPARRMAVPTEAQKNLVLTGLMLGFVSIFAAFFPVCGLPIALTGLLIGFYGRRTTSLQMMSSWAFALSLVGLILAFIYTIVTISIYLGNYLFLP
jgi:membrane-bound ClpP family serine protease